MSSFFKIQGSVKKYDWGKKGLESVVAHLQKSANEGFVIDESEPYAEMWMGTHSSGPATVPSLNINLKEFLENHPQRLGENILNKYGKSSGLPFLLKVLSVGKSLSIQVHPNKDTAVTLHKSSPENYPDDNHKPEMAIALTNFEALCGFRPTEEIKHFFNEIPQLKNIVNSDIVNKFVSSNSPDDFKAVFKAIMTCSEEIFQPQLLKIAESFKHNKFSSQQCSSIQDLFIRIYNQYPGDIGCFCVFFLNYIKLIPGEAIYLAANEPHAYLYGDCVECMACSDNVVRAGLTPKFRDVETLCNILTYDCKTGEENKFLPITDLEDPFRKVFNPPVEEFVVDHIVLQEVESYSLKVLESASILLIVEGKGICQGETEEVHISPGCVFFISSCSKIYIKHASQLILFRAYCTV